jgi:hypothetical protein
MSFKAMAASFLLLLAAIGFGQTGRGFLSIEAAVGMSRSFQVGTITSIEKVDFVYEAKQAHQYGNVYRLKVHVTETIRGPKAKDLTLLLAVQIIQPLTYMKDHKIEVLLIGGNRLLGTHFMSSYPLLEEQGKRVDGEVYQIRPLENIDTEDIHQEDREGKQLNTDFDSGKFFDINLNVIDNRTEILRHARTFAKKYPEVLTGFWFMVPNSFGVHCGYTNAFCGITLPYCDESRRTLERIKKDPDLLLKDEGKTEWRWDRAKILDQVSKTLGTFPKNNLLLFTVDPNSK